MNFVNKPKQTDDIQANRFAIFVLFFFNSFFLLEIAFFVFLLQVTDFHRENAPTNNRMDKVLPRKDYDLVFIQFSHSLVMNGTFANMQCTQNPD